MIKETIYSTNSLFKKVKTLQPAVESDHQLKYNKTESILHRSLDPNGVNHTETSI